jgi:hypothetical protein
MNIGQLKAKQNVEIIAEMVCEFEVIKKGDSAFMFLLEFIPKYGAKDGRLNALIGNVIPFYILKKHHA